MPQLNHSYKLRMLAPDVVLQPRAALNGLHPVALETTDI